MQPQLGFYHILYLCLTALPHYDCLPFYIYGKILHSSYIPNGTWHLERSSHNLKNSCYSIILWHHTQMLPTFLSRLTYPLPYITYHIYVLPNNYRMKKKSFIFLTEHSLQLFHMSPNVLPHLQNLFSSVYHEHLPKHWRIYLAN